MDRYDAVDLGSGYGSVGGAAFRGMQQELLRRLAAEEAARAEAQRNEELRLQHERLARQDARQAQQDALDKRIKEETLQGAKETREALNAQRGEETKKKQREAFTSTHRPGQKLTPEEKQQAEELGLGGFTLVVPGMPKAKAPTALPGMPVDAAGAGAAPAAPAATEPESAPEMSADEAEYLGTEEQARKKQDNENVAKQRQFADDFVAGKLDDQFGEVDPQALAAAKVIVRVSGPTGVPGALSSLMKPPKAPAETMAADSLAIEKTFYNQAIAAGKTPDEAKVEARRKFNALQGEQARTRQDITIRQQTSTREDAQQDRAIAAAYKRVDTAQQPLAQMLSRAGRLTNVLVAGGGLGDATAAPEFLQIMAGGYGSGLRMTDTELNRINFSKSQYSKFMQYVQGLVVGRPPVLDEYQRQDMVKLTQYLASRALAENEIYNEYLDKINDAGSAKEARALETEMKRKLDKDLISGFAPGTGPTGAAGATGAKPALPAGVSNVVITPGKKQ